MRTRDGLKILVRTKDGTYSDYEDGTIDWTRCEAIEREPARMHGGWRFKGAKTPLADLFRALAAGSNTAEFVAANNGVGRSAPEAVLGFIAEQMEDTEEALWNYGGPRTATPPALDGGEHNRDAVDDPERTHWKDCKAASRDAERMSGSWCIGHTRFPLHVVFSNLAGMGSIAEFVDNFDATREETVPLLQFLADDFDRGEHAARTATPDQDPP